MRRTRCLPRCRAIVATPWRRGGKPAASRPSGVSMCACRARAKRFFSISDSPESICLPTTETLLTTPDIERMFSGAQRIQRMLDFEAALAVAQYEAGLISAAARDAIAACCRADRFDADMLLNSAHSAGNAAIPLVSALTKAV